jgi:hypothetical protein
MSDGKTTGGERRDRSKSARDWLVLIAIGLLVWAIGGAMDSGIAALGMLMVIVCAFGLLWRLLKGR